VQTKATVTIILAGTHQYQGLAFSRDGAYLYVSTRRPASLIRVATLGGPTSKLLDDIATGVSVSPDGRQLAYVRARNNEADLVVASADGSNPRTLVVEKRPPLGVPAWSPDGQTVAWPRALPRAGAAITLTAVDGSRKEEVVIPGWQYVDSVVWLPTGLGFVITAEETSREVTGRHQILEVSYPGLSIKRLTNDLGDYHNLTGNPRTALAAVPLVYRSAIAVGTLEAPEALRRMGTGGSDGARGVAWAPDGRLVFTDAYSVGWIMNDDGSGLRPLLPERQTAVGPFACGTAIAYTMARGTALSLLLVDPDAGKPRHVIDIPWSEGASCTSDGASLLFDDNETIKKVRTSAADEATVVQEGAHDPRVSPDGLFLAAHARSGEAETFVIFSMKDNALVRRLPGPVGGNYQWDPDGKALISSRRRGNVGNLWRIPIDGGPAVQLTHFTSDLMFQFSLARDRRLAVARGETAHDVVLLTASLDRSRLSPRQ